MTGADALDFEPTIPPRRPLKTGLGVRLGYGAGQIGGQIFRDTPALLLPVYLTTVLGVPAWMAGLCILLPKAWIIFCDPLVGAWSDRLNRAHGRRPFILAGAIASGLGFVILFATPGFASPWASSLYITAMFTLALSGFSLFSVPYLSLAAELSDDPDERTEILTYRLVFTAVGLLIGAGVAQPLVAWLGGGRGGFLRMALIVGPVCTASMLITFATTRHARLRVSAAPSLSFMGQLRLAAASRPFVGLAAAYSLQMLSQATGYTVFALFFIYMVKHIELLIPVILTSSITIIAAQPLWLWMSKRWGKRPTYVVAVIGWALVTASWLAAVPSAGPVVIVPLLGPLSNQEIWLLVRSLGLGVFNSGVSLMAFSTLTDTIEADRMQTGQGKGGVFSGLFSALEKVAFAAGPALAGVVLTAMGFAASTQGVIHQSASAIRAILIDLGAIPAGLALVSLAPLLLWNRPQVADDEPVPR